jgi:hypothetical protein
MLEVRGLIGGPFLVSAEGTPRAMLLKSGFIPATRISSASSISKMCLPALAVMALGMWEV